ncbi:MAG: hypothetical protein JWM33_3977, partial [Caulobacteraceae bacterium]|nr:hypothetical protein [Caulobacteraceae bacterium]
MSTLRNTGKTLAVFGLLALLGAAPAPTPWTVRPE